MTLGPHATFILIAYAVVTAVVAALVVWVMVDYRSQQATLRQLDAEGVSRRSARKAKDRA